MQNTTPKKTAKQQAIITPESIATNNQFAALLSEEGSESTHSTTSHSNHSSSSSNSSISLFNMTETRKDMCCISKAELKHKMEKHEHGVTDPKENPTCTDVILFREAMANTVKELPVSFHNNGFCSLVDTTEEFIKRTGDEPRDMPRMPNRPMDRTSKQQMKACSFDLSECQQAAHMKDIGISLLKETFPHCLTFKEGPCIPPRDFHLKDALTCVLENTTSEMEQADEFSSFMSRLLNNSCNHIPKTKSLDQCLKSIEKSKEGKILWHHVRELGSTTSPSSITHKIRWPMELEEEKTHCMTSRISGRQNKHCASHKNGLKTKFGMHSRHPINKR